MRQEGPKLEEIRWFRVLWPLAVVLVVGVALVDALFPHLLGSDKGAVTWATAPKYYPLFKAGACVVLLVIARMIAIAFERKDNFYASD
jgi:hypothetical protein